MTVDLCNFGIFFSQAYFRRAEAMKAVGCQAIAAGGDPVQCFYHAIQDYGECYKRMGNTHRETGMRVQQYHNALELSVCCCK